MGAPSPIHCYAGEPGNRLKPGEVPTSDGIDISNPAALEAFYGNFSFCEHWRKVLLANCYEIELAKANLRNEKVSETRLKELARLHPAYRGFLADHFTGRQAREQNARESGTV